MYFTDDDDDLPDIPQTHQRTSHGAMLDQAERLRSLEEEFRQFKADMLSQQRVQSAHSASSAPIRERREGEADDDDRRPQMSSSNGRLSSQQSEEAQYELRSLVPHLSPTFTCSYRDAVLLITAIRNGGGGGHGKDSLMDKLGVAESEKRMLEQKLHKKADECDSLKNDVADARQRLRAVKEESQKYNGALAQRREEMRKNLLVEETRTQKLQVRNRKLEAENEQLKSRLRDSFH